MRDQNWVSDRVRRFTRWPGPSRRRLEELLRPDGDLWLSDEQLMRRIRQAQRFLEALSPTQRRKLWSSVFPNLAAHIEVAWQSMGIRPYQYGYPRMPFRAPRHTVTIAHNRARFFLGLCEMLRGLDPTAAWLASWIAHLPESEQYDHQAPTWVLSAILQAGGPDAEAVRSVLHASIEGTDPIGTTSWQAIVILLNSSQREDWELIGKLLLAARRQEGLRQCILENADLASPEAFRYILGLVLEHDLVRFSSTVRAMDVWLGMKWAGGSVTQARKTIARLAELLDTPDQLETVARQADPAEAYLALWAIAYEDAQRAIRLAARLLNDESPARRYVALQTISNCALLPDSIETVIDWLESSGESDARLLTVAIEFFSNFYFERLPGPALDAVAAAVSRLPQKKTRAEPLVWPWTGHVSDRRSVSYVLRQLAGGATGKLASVAHLLDSEDCAHVIYELAGMDRWGSRSKRRPRKLSEKNRRLVIGFISDTRPIVCTAAFEALEGTPLKRDEVELLVGGLHRKAGYFRSKAIDRLLRLDDRQLLAVIEELLDDAHVLNRAAGLELAAHMVEAGRHSAAARDLVARRRDSLTDPDLLPTLDRVLAGATAPASADDCLGLAPPDSRSPLPQPDYVGVVIETPATRAYLKELAELFLRHGDVEVEVRNFSGGRERRLLSAAGAGLPLPHGTADQSEAARQAFPLAEVWLSWFEQRTAATRDPDGLEPVRAWAWTERGESYLSSLPKQFSGYDTHDLRAGFERVLCWLAVRSGSRQTGGFLVQYAEDALAASRASSEEKKDLRDHNRIFEDSLAARRYAIACTYLRYCPQAFAPADRARLGLLGLLGLQRKLSGFEHHPELGLFLAAYDHYKLKPADFLWFLLQPREPRGGRNWRFYGPIARVSRLRGCVQLQDHPELVEAVERLRRRLIELELARGERPTPASDPARNLSYAGGAEVFFRLLKALGSAQIVRQHEWGDQPTRAFSLSRLLAATAPAPGDTLESFAALYGDSGVSADRLLEATMFAPQWAAHVEHVLDFPGLEDAVWWIHAHTRKATDWRDEEIRELWAARVAERTALAAEDLEQGAVDVAWFRRVIATIGLDGWRRLKRPSRYASSSSGHKRAMLFADAMLGNIDADALLERIDAKRHQDSVRALGLLPLPSDQRRAREETLRRYQRIQEFKRQSRKFGSQRQASEGQAVEIALQNLARTAGFSDPRRLTWAMEAEAVADLAAGPVVVTLDDTELALAVTPEGEPDLTVHKSGRKLKAIPARLRKREPVAELRQRLTELRRQRSRMRLALEQAMCRGDQFSSSELRQFFEHPLLRPMIERLVFVGDSDLVGYPVEDGRLLRDHAGRLEPVGQRDRLRIAHPLDLLQRGDWHAWQRECFSAERVQPFKQVFRETYPKTATERGGCCQTARYAGHQVQTRQALALFKGREWVADPELGVRRVFHDADLVAELHFQEGFWTPAEIEDLTLEALTFVRRGKPDQPVPLDTVPDRIFSETMRDVDLVVSVAHAGGVDPEASASTVEMRARLVEETARLLKLSNVRVEGHHVLIDGRLASYSVHLGSAVAMVRPGRMLLIVAVHSQYRGRLFLPFADDDPCTAEVLAKTLLLARDQQIRDPGILSQIRG